jgi:hypothetical protein
LIKPRHAATLRAAGDVRIEEIARRLDTRILQPTMAASGGADTVVASDRMSDLLEHATSTTLIITSLATSQVLDVAELMDAPAICITTGDSPPADFLGGALRCRVPVILSRLGPEETRRRVALLLQSSEGATE